MALFAPLAAALTVAVIVTAVHRRLPPHLAARMLTVTLAVVLGSAAPTVWMVSLGYVSHLPWSRGRLQWCAEAFGFHEPISNWVGIVALGLSAVGVVRTRSAWRLYRTLRLDTAGPVEIAEHQRPFAFTLPGRGGRIVLSTAMVDLLDDDEHAVVLAHEQAHARFRHDRYLLTAQLAEAVVPLMRPLARRLQFSLERWADEVAVSRCGDRDFVARTLGKVALCTVAPVGALGFAGLGVPGRLEALLAPAPARPGRSLLVAIWLTIGVTAALSVFQLHHVLKLAIALCPG